MMVGHLVVPACVITGSHCAGMTCLNTVERTDRGDREGLVHPRDKLDVGVCPHRGAAEGDAADRRPSSLPARQTSQPLRQL